MIEELASRIWSHERFHDDFRHLQKAAMRKRYLLEHTEPSLPAESLQRLLRSAAALSASCDQKFREMAYRIVVAASDMEGQALPGVPYVLLLALSRIGNFPAMEFAKRHYAITEESLPTREYVESSIRQDANSVQLGERRLPLTDFQFQLWRQLGATDTLGISAPTSAGKSFVLHSYALKLFREGGAKNIVFLVPTRALINQLSGDVTGSLATLPFSAELITTPVPSDTSLPERAIFVLTQERLQLLHTAHKRLKFDLMLVDEAQSIADGPRGVLLYSVIREAVARNRAMQLLFAGPNLADPDRITKLFRPTAVSIKTAEAAVVQNIFLVDCDGGNSKKAALSLLSGERKIALGEIVCDQRLTDHKSKLVQIALRLGDKGQNLIYAMGPSECEKIAFGLADTEAEYEIDDLKELSTFIKDAVHPKYQLAQNVLSRVGFHYGRLPSLVRKAIEDAFSSGAIQNLVTTSTLLQGVNMPAQNLFLHNPQKGRNEPISAVDFWNLAGRAGRLGKEFTGNIFLIDYGSWPNDPMAGERELETVPAIERHVAAQTVALTEYIEDTERMPDRNKPDEYENTFVELVRNAWDGTLEQTLSSLGLSSDEPNSNTLIEAVRKVVATTDVTQVVLEQSPTVSIHRQQSLFERLEEGLQKHGASELIPKHPLESGAYESYAACMKRCHDEILKYPKRDNSHRYFAQSCIRWMRGEPLPSIIDNKMDYEIKRGRNPAIATVIRNTLDEVEQDLRFKYVRLFSCYNAVLEAVFAKHQLQRHIESIPPIPLFLEVGACSPTMISFMGLGLSRYTAGKLRALPRRDDMTQADARSWLLRQDIEALDLPIASIGEIKRMVPAARARA